MALPLLMLGLVVPTAFGETGAGAPEPNRCEWAFWYQDQATQWDGFLMLWNPIMETQNLEVSIVTASQVLRTSISLTANESILLNSEGIKGKKQFGALRVVGGAKGRFSATLIQTAGQNIIMQPGQCKFAEDMP